MFRRLRKSHTLHGIAFFILPWTRRESVFYYAKHRATKIGFRTTLLPAPTLFTPPVPPGPNRLREDSIDAPGSFGTSKCQGGPGPTPRLLAELLDSARNYIIREVWEKICF